MHKKVELTFIDENACQASLMGSEKRSRYCFIMCVAASKNIQVTLRLRDSATIDVGE